VHKYVTVNGVRLHYVEKGKQTLPLLLCLHGFPERWWSWRYFLLAFSGSFHVVAVDQRGYGLSDAPGWGWFGSPHYTVRKLAEDVPALVAALGHKRAVIAAHDWGVVVAWAAAGLLQRKDALDGLIVINGPHLGSYHARAGLQQYMRSLYIAIFQIPWVAEAWLSVGDYAMIDYMFFSTGMGVQRRSGPLALTKADAEVFKWGLRRPGRLSAALNWYRQLPGSSGSDFAALAPSASAPLTAPCLVLWGVDDKALGEELVSDTHTYATQCTVVKLTHCSHWAQQDAVEDVVSAVANFLHVKAPAKLL